TIIVPNGTASGLYYVEITATSNSFAENISIFVQVMGTDFNLFAYPSSLKLSQGGSASTTLIISGIGGFTGLVNFTAYSLGYVPGLEESFSPLNVTLSQSSPNATLTMTVSASLDTPAGAYNVTVVGVSYSGGGFPTHTVTVVVTVLVRPDFTIATSPVFINIVQGTTGSSTISLTNINGLRIPDERFRRPRQPLSDRTRGIHHELQHQPDHGRLRNLNPYSHRGQLRRNG